MTKKNNRIYRSYRLEPSAIKKITEETNKIKANGIDYDYSDFLNDLILNNTNCLLKKVNTELKDNVDIELEKALKIFERDYLFKFSEKLERMKEKIYKTFRNPDERIIICILNDYVKILKDVKNRYIKYIDKIEGFKFLDESFNNLINCIEQKRFVDLKEECNYVKKDIDKMISLSIKYGYVINKQRLNDEERL